ncbi:cupin domain-containing protein [Vibrio hangzhouensis]|uniref:cupin domain-containing protein n=1 Tax=Vibrio hangzhouensis TaxID=462991 RepID=UPI001C98069A|nr:cupin domain-containing protein [Vibrio hangzhouensis]MBY6195671.1 cupin domain-containing protein [Vibrio hangzhouensis]
MLNMDFSQRIVIDTEQMTWIASPESGVKRKPLEREALESGHVTSIVEYLPGASFHRHTHPLGEEILVLQGVFSDEHGDYPAGTYIRNPPGSAHTPFSEQGCIILVKLNQFDPEDLTPVCIDTNVATWQPSIGQMEILPLHHFKNERVVLIRWRDEDSYHSHGHFGGEEIFVLEGRLIDEMGEYPKGTWTRNPHESHHQPYVNGPTTIWFKSGHLPIK